MALARPAVRMFILNDTSPLIVYTLLQTKLPPGANRILFVKNLNYQITGEDLYDLFGRYGSIRQIRLGNEAKTKGTAFVVFEDVMDVRTSFFSISSDIQRRPYVGQKCSRPSERFPSSRALYSGTLSYASETGCSCNQGRPGSEGRGVGTLEAATRHQG